MIDSILISRLKAKIELGLADVDHVDAYNALISLSNGLSQSMTAIDDWLNIYAEEFCGEERVLEAKKRVSEQGTVGYIADVQEINRHALKSLNPLTIVDISSEINIDNPSEIWFHPTNEQI